MFAEAYRHPGVLVAGLLIIIAGVYFLQIHDADDHGRQPFNRVSETESVTRDTGTTVPHSAVPGKANEINIAGFTEKDRPADASRRNATTERNQKRALLSSHTPEIRLAGTIMAGAGKSYALLVEEHTGRQKLYKVGETIQGFTLIKIEKSSVIIEKSGQLQSLKVTGEPVLLQAPQEVWESDGPAYSGEALELPEFKPVINKTGPLPDSTVKYKALPEFIPLENDSGPPER